METDFLKNNILSILEKSTSVENKLQAICDFLKQEINYYDWVGFYFKNGDKDELKLGTCIIESRKIDPAGVRHH